MIAWAVLMLAQGNDLVPYLPFLCSLVMVAGISFVDDIHSLPDSVRMGVQILAVLLMFWSVGLYGAFDSWIWMVVVAAIALFFCVGATNIINFMDGINGITAVICDASAIVLGESNMGFVEESYMIVLPSAFWCSLSSTSAKRQGEVLTVMWNCGIAFIILFAPVDVGDKDVS